MNACAHAAVLKASRPRTSLRRPKQAVGEGRTYNKERKIIISTFFEIQSYVISMNFEIMKSARHSAPVPPRPSPARRLSPRSIGIGQGRGARSFCRATLSAIRSASPSVGRASACADRAKLRARLPRGGLPPNPPTRRPKSKSAESGERWGKERSGAHGKSYRAWQIIPRVAIMSQEQIIRQGENHAVQGRNHIEENHVAEGESCCK